MRKSRSLIRLFYPYYLLIILLSLFALTWYATNLIRRIYLDRTAEDLRSRSYLIADLISGNLSRGNYEDIDTMCDSLGIALSSRFTVILPTGIVVADSEEDPLSMDNHADRPEIQQAMQGETGIATRFSHTLNQHMMYVAIAVHSGKTTIGIVRSSLPVTALSQTLNTTYRRIAVAVFVISLVATLLSLFLSRYVRRPVQAMKQGAARFGEGELDHRLHIRNPEEFSTLAEAMNIMAAQLSERLQTITRQRNELEGVLTSMVEAVLVVSGEEKIIRFNTAAGELFSIRPDEAKDRSIQEVIRNTDLLRFIRETFASFLTIEKEITLHEQGDRFLQAHGTLLAQNPQENTSALIVLNDITRLKRLENIRKDFVANVSHELKTPITAIKGSVETLKSGAVKDPNNAIRFLDIILKHSDRLNTIIEDLLSLSRIDEKAEKGKIVLRKTNVIRVLSDAVAVCRDQATKKRIKLELVCDENLKARMNPPLLEEAIINLIDNAIKYSNKGKQVRIEGTQNDSETSISVQDSGCGIPEEHLPRIFERFYRVDKARSRNLGGTGLGLAIVKHIVQAQGGQVTVESVLGKGSTFTVHLPNTAT
jgi:two-component system phosphate regulon sensor histidine kinase PhoR